VCRGVAVTLCSVYYIQMKNQNDLLEAFKSAIGKIYPKEEAANITSLVFENITGRTPISSGDYAAALTEEQSKRLEEIQQRLLNNEPVQYILQEAWFYDIPLYVDSNVLIPRPETEELVDWIIKENQQRQDLSILDLGTGSGCIPVVLKRKLPQAKVYACDISAEALAVAGRNASRNQAEIVFFLLDILDRSEWNKIPQVDILVSNPPYVPENNKESLRPNVLDFEPGIALFVADQNPLLFYEMIAELGQRALKPGGRVYVEIHEELGPDVTKLFQSKGYTTTLKQDMQGKDRMVKAIFQGN